MTFLGRYLGGQHKEVWADLLALGAIEDADTLKDTMDVVFETMNRSRRNIEKIVGHLKVLNYEFLYPSEIYTPPSASASQKLEEFEKLAGPIPLSILYFYERVGSVNLSGVHSSWFPDDYPDPLVIEPIEYFLDYGYSEWKEENEKLAPKERKKLRLELSPDFHHKANVSGGLPYAIELPNASVDAPFLEEWHKTTFVDYLRVAFKWGGFPGFQKSAHPPNEFIVKVTEGLEPI